MKKLSLLVAAALMVPVAHAHQAGDILVRGGAMAVSPTTDSGDINPAAKYVDYAA